MGGDPRKRILGQWDGARDGWGAKLPLKIDEEAVEIDASAVRFAVPTFLLRLRAFVEWHLEKGHSVRVKCPSNGRVAEYMRRSEIAKGLPEDVFLGLPDLPPAADSDVLIPIRKLREPADVDRLGEKL